MSEHRSVSTEKYAVSVRCSRTVALSTAPVSPMPPIVAQNTRSVSPAGVSVRTSPSAISRSSDCTWLPKLPWV